MMYQAAAATTAPFLTVLLLVRISAMVEAHSIWEKLQVEQDGIRFNVAFRDGGYTKPYRMKFTEDGVGSVYKFKADGCVTNIKVGSERYEVVYDASADLTGIVRTESLNTVEDDDLDVGAVFENRRRLFSSCDDCTSTWDAMCDKGAPSVCNLLDFESKVSPEAVKSFETVCKTFGAGPCSMDGGPEACDGLCEDDGVPREPTPSPSMHTVEPSVESTPAPHTDPTEPSVEPTPASSQAPVVPPTESGRNSCLDPQADDTNCFIESNGDVIISECDMTDSDLGDLAACLDYLGRPNIEGLFITSNPELTTLPVELFWGLTSLTSLTITDNGLTSVSEDVFSDLPTLETIFVGGNPELKSIPEGIFRGLPALQIIALGQNALTTLPEAIFSGKTLLRGLYIDNNKLEFLPAGLFSDVLNVTALSLEANDLEALPAGMFSGLTALEKLYLEGNNLATLPSDLFADLTSMTELHLTSNDLSIISAGLFSGLTVLEFLFIRANGITTLPDGIFSDLASLETLSIEQADLQCLPPVPESAPFGYQSSNTGTCDCPENATGVCTSGETCSSGEEGYVCG